MTTLVLACAMSLSAPQPWALAPEPSPYRREVGPEIAMIVVLTLVGVYAVALAVTAGRER